jgi:hypothetical protein
LAQAVLKWPAWVVVVELVGLKHCVFAAHGPGCREVFGCVEMREIEAFGDNADLELSSWAALQDVIMRDGVTME